jgi:acid stress chaperone HdeB
MTMTKFAAASCVVVALGTIQPAYAQVTLDIAKVTCDQWVGYKITNPQNIALWLSGYLNGTRGNTLLDTQRLTADTQRVRAFCITNPEVPIMQAVEKVIATPIR